MRIIIPSVERCYCGNKIKRIDKRFKYCSDFCSENFLRIRCLIYRGSSKGRKAKKRYSSSQKGKRTVKKYFLKNKEAIKKYQREYHRDYYHKNKAYWQEYYVKKKSSNPGSGVKALKIRSP